MGNTNVSDQNKVRGECWHNEESDILLCCIRPRSELDPNLRKYNLVIAEIENFLTEGIYFLLQPNLFHLFLKYTLLQA